MTISVPGKVFLSGEHAVVYGAKAVLAAVGLRCTADVRLGELGIIKVNGKSYQEAELKEFAKEAKSIWEQFQKTGNLADLKKWMSEEDGLIKVVLGESLIKGGKSGLDIEINSSIPIGSGMGSSAAVATVLGAATGLKDKDLDEVVTESERRQHGNPSGADQATVLNGGLVEYQKINDQKIIKSVSFKKKLPEFILINSGKPDETTGEMVALVADKFKTKQNDLRLICLQVGKISERWLTGEEPGKLIKANNQCLQKFGVMGEKAKVMVKKIESIGGAAKICGAGGIKAGSGTMLAYHDQTEKLKQLVKQEGWEFYPVELGVEGLRYEKN